MSEQRRRKRKGTSFENEYSMHLSLVSSSSKLPLTSNYILVAEDVETYPKPDSIIAVTSDAKPRYWYASREDYDDDIMDMSMGTKDVGRVFNNFAPTYEDGTKDLRYFLVVDHINDDGDIVAYDDKDGMHVFKDNQVTVVDLYLYPSTSHKATFKVGYKFSENPLAVSATTVFRDQDGVCSVIHDNNQLMFERCLITLNRDSSKRLTDVYAERGIVIENNVPIVRIRLEYGVLYGNTLESGLTPYVSEAIHNLRTMGYHIDLCSDVFKSYMSDFKDVEHKLDELGIEYNTFNAMYKYDFIIDTRSAMSYGDINWTQVFYNITKKPLMELLMNETSETAPLLGDLDDVQESMFQFSGEYSDLLEISENAFNELKEQGSLTDVYPLAPIEWTTIKLLQDVFKSNIEFESCTEDYKELISVLGLRDFFD